MDRMPKSKPGTKAVVRKVARPKKTGQLKTAGAGKSYGAPMYDYTAEPVAQPSLIGRKILSQGRNKGTRT
jgi:hypothetical protein